MSLADRWNKFSRRERYLLGVAAAVALVVAAYYAATVPFADLSLDTEDATWVQIQKIKNYQRIISRFEGGENRSKILKLRYQQAQNRLIAGATPTQVGAQLQGMIGSMAAGAGLNVLSSQILKEEELEEFRRVGVRLTLSGNLEGIARLISSIETDRKDFVVTLLEINRKLGAKRRPTPTRAPTAFPVAPLTATMEVRTFLQAAL